MIKRYYPLHHVSTGRKDKRYSIMKMTLTKTYVATFRSESLEEKEVEVGYFRTDYDAVAALKQFKKNGNTAPPTAEEIRILQDNVDKARKLVLARRFRAGRSDFEDTLAAYADSKVELSLRVRLLTC